MAYEVACKDLGNIDCDFVAKGETMEELMASAGPHGKEVHGYTDEQMNDPKMAEQVMAAVKQV